MKFIDEAIIEVRGGDGGDGCVSFRREAGTPRGGPNGGNGGDGGDVILVADSRLATLLDLQYRRYYRANRGEHGRGKDQSGRKGEAQVVRVPTGTVIYSEESGDRLCDLSQEGDKWIAAKGGRGGRGNASFATSTHRAPRIAEKGEKGESRKLRLVLKLLADVGLVGLPNAGKSTLIAKISKARPKIADYPFTTLVPNLATVQHHDQSFVVADIPGLIEGAHRGAGLGDPFLKHIERTSLLIFLLDLSPDTPQSAIEQWRTLRGELRAYNSTLLEKPFWITGNKIDLPEAKENWKGVQKELSKEGKTMAISALTGENIDFFTETVAKEVQNVRKRSVNDGSV